MLLFMIVVCGFTYLYIRPIMRGSQARNIQNSTEEEKNHLILPLTMFVSVKYDFGSYLCVGLERWTVLDLKLLMFKV